ncbi:MAG TPA: histidine kinase [Nocardioides sp.]|uniref:sensor histidine kinase n=1 Tax=Nocardioides sp. TaxID=35761 RepID=UPI002E2FFEBD|nr:histidine kinase [Nocardioides sp.]HEX5090979.1 histidine kinase [Nocardioides sp.]
MEALPLTTAVVSASFALSGCALLLRRRAMVSALLLVAGGGVGVVAGVLLARGHSDTAAATATFAGAVLLPLALALYPEPRWRRVPDFLGLVVLAGCGTVATAYHEPDVTALMAIVQGCAFVAHTWWRIETSDGPVRRSLTWMVLAVTTTVLVYFVLSFSSEASSAGLTDWGLLVFALVGPALYVGATLPDLVDVRGLVVSTVVTTVALVTVMSVFVLELSLLDALGAHDLNTGALAVLAALAAVAFQPTRVVLRGVVDQLLFGERPDPLGAASTVAGRIGEDPQIALRAIREALVIPYAALLVDGVPLAASGAETTHTRTLDLDGAGELVVGLRPGDLTFSPGDEQVLRLTVPLLAQTLRTRALAEDLIESRGQTIAAVEEERRRLRRELHDGLGPRLSGVAFTSDAARNLIRTDPAAAEQMVAQLRADTVAAIEEIRRMVYAMRPPALDELGLVPALRQQAVGLRNRAGEPVAVQVTAPEELPDLPAAVEVAAYRIVTEALTNVARHSTSASASVRLDPASDGLHVEVTDRGTSDAWRPGVGLSSMRERAAELGGTLEAGPGPTGGRVAALLPL